MILNGKALDNFYSWWENKIKTENFQYFKPREDVFLNALIIEFFDSVGIYIGFYHDSLFLQCYVNNDNVGKYKSRQEATTQAIKKANDIYNERTSL